MVRAWRYGGGGWLQPFMIFNGLGQDLRPLGYPDVPPARPRMPAYRHFMFAAARYFAVFEDGFEDGGRSLSAQDLRSVLGAGSG